MKKLVIIGLLLGSQVFAFNWNSFVGMFKKTAPSISYTVESSGLNPRVYEFDTQGLPKLHCVVFLRNDTKTSPTMQCIKTNEDMIKANKKLAK